MIIEKAEKEEFEKIRSFYYEVIDGFAGKKYHPQWEKDIYPAPEELRELLDKGQIYTGKTDGKIVSAMALNHECNEGYAQFGWPTKAEKEEVFVIHMLAVLPSHGKKAFVGIEPFEKFFPAEEYHQDYAIKNPEAFEKELLESGRKKR